MLDQHDKITEAAAFIRARWSREPRVAIILGSGLGGVSGLLAESVTIPYHDIPHFARSTAHGHAGQLVCGLLEGVAVMVMEGRMHAYEGYPLQQITFPVRVAKRLGAGLLVFATSLAPLAPLFSPQAEAPWQLWLPVLAQVTLMGRVLKGEGVDPAAAGLSALLCALLAAAILAWLARTLRQAALR